MSEAFNNLPKSPREAKDRGERYYFTGTPCRHGHINKRIAASATCVECDRVRTAEYQRINPPSPEYNRERAKRWYHRNKERIAPENRRKVREYGEKNKALIASKRKLPAYKARKCAHERMREAQKRRATPPWLTPDQIREMKQIYLASALRTEETGVLHHVDHIEPLLGATSCGLHVPWNLQILTWHENVRKNNKLTADTIPLTSS